MGFSFNQKNEKVCESSKKNNAISKSNKQSSDAKRDAIRLRFMFNPLDESNFKFPKISNKGWGELFHNKLSGKKNGHGRRGGAVIIDGDEMPCSNCFTSIFSQTLVLRTFLQAIPHHLKEMKNNCFGKGLSKSAQKTSTDNLSSSFINIGMLQFENPRSKPVDKAKDFSLELCVGMLLEFCLHSTPLNKCMEKTGKAAGDKFVLRLPDLNDIFLLKGFFTDEREAFQSNSSFARVNGAPLVVQGTKGGGKDHENPKDESARVQESVSGVIDYTPAQKLGADAHKLGSDIVNFSVENVKKLKSVLSTMSLADLMALVPQKGRSAQDHPDKKRLGLVQDFFKYTQNEGKRFFEELDRDGDGKITLEDLEVAMRKRRLPTNYAREFLRRTRSHIFAKSIGWKQFLSLMEQKEAAMLQAYNSLCLSKSGTLQKNQVLESLKKAGLPASEDNVAAMMRYLDADTEGYISYGHFRNFMLLLPPERLEDDIRSLWFEAATVVAVPPPIPISTGAGSVLAAALAGGLSSALSTSLMHPLDTLKTRVQASTLSFPVVLSKVPEIGVEGLYRGSIPAILGQFSSHGMRTGFSEATRKLLEKTCPEFSDIQVESIASLVGTFLGTATRIPCEVLKQRLQAGIFDNVGAAIFGTWEKDGLKGFFRGTGATLCREVPFYVAGSVLYTESKKVAQDLAKRELAPWETLAVGALSGGLAAVATTPFDVLKTRMMTAPPGVPVTMLAIASAILQQEGPLGLFKGALPRFFWIAPLGAMNFAGYELAKKTIISKQTTTVT